MLIITNYQNQFVLKNNNYMSKVIFKTSIVFVLLFHSLSCSADKIISADLNLETCDFLFKTRGFCKFKGLTVNINTKSLSADEKILQNLNIVSQENNFILNLTKDVTMLDGDKGYISFADINFDSIPDISITTSFGLANLYMDYWVYDSVNKAYSYIGNFSSFKINNKSKMLSNVVKSSAAGYINTTYIWNGLKLKKK